LIIAAVLRDDECQNPKSNSQNTNSGGDNDCGSIPMFFLWIEPCHEHEYAVLREGLVALEVAVPRLMAGLPVKGHEGLFINRGCPHL